MQNDVHSSFFDYVAGVNFRSVICLDGILPDRSFFQMTDLPIFACDGAANTLIAMEVSPDCILGDLDSISPLLSKEYPVLHLPDQNFSDFEKTMQYLDARALLPSIILGVNGGCIDHILHNITIFARMAEHCLFYDPPIVGQILQAKGMHHFKRPLGSKLSLLPTAAAKVSTSGLKWDLHNEMLLFPQKNSCFNRTEAQEVLIEVHEGTLLLCLYLQPISDAGVRVN